MDREQSLIIPSLFDGTNYAHWKVCIRAFLQSLDENMWQTMEIGWTKPTDGMMLRSRRQTSTVKH